MDVTVRVCPGCDAETVHDVVKERGRERTITCRECDHTHHVVQPRTIEVPLHVSRGADTEPTTVELEESDEVEVGDRFVVPDGLAEVTAVEDEGGHRPDTLKASKIQTIWAKDIQEIDVKVTIHHGRTSRSLQTTMGPDEPLRVGDRITVEGRPMRIDRIKAEGRMLRRDGQSAPASDVVRVYADPED